MRLTDLGSECPDLGGELVGGEMAEATAARRIERIFTGQSFVNTFKLFGIETCSSLDYMGIFFQRQGITESNSMWKPD